MRKSGIQKPFSERRILRNSFCIPKPEDSMSGARFKREAIFLRRWPSDRFSVSRFRESRFRSFVPHRFVDVFRISNQDFVVDVVAQDRVVRIIRSPLGSDDFLFRDIPPTGYLSYPLFPRLKVRKAIPLGNLRMQRTARLPEAWPERFRPPDQEVRTVSARRYPILKNRPFRKTGSQTVSKSGRGVSVPMELSIVPSS